MKYTLLRMFFNRSNVMIFILFLIIGFYGSVHGQETPYNENIKWENDLSELNLGIEKVKVISFENALHFEQNNFLPVYSSTIPLPLPNLIAEVKIIESKTSTKSFIDNSFSGYENIKSDYQIISKTTTIKKKSYLVIDIIPIRKTETEYELLESFNLDITFSPLMQRGGKGQDWANVSALANGSWYKLNTTEKGIHKITASDLQDAGINYQAIDPRNIRIYGSPGGMISENNADPQPDDIKEIAIEVVGEDDGIFNSDDYILFYAESIDSWTYHDASQTFRHLKHLYTKQKSFFLNWDIGSGKRISSINGSSQSITNTVTTFNDYQYHESDSINIIKSGREWYGEYFNVVTDHSFQFNFPNINSQHDVVLRSSLAAKSNYPSSYTVTANGNTMTQGIQKIPGSYISQQAMTNDQSLSFMTPSSTISVDVVYNNHGISSAEGWLNFLEINARRNLNFANGQLLFRDIETVGIGKTSKFEIGFPGNNLKIWDVTSFNEIKSISATANANVYSFIQDTDSLREFIAHDGTSYHQVIFEGQLPNQNLHGLSDIDFVIVTHPDFRAQAQRIADYHLLHDNGDLNIVMVEPEQIYNEFSGGEPDIGALRNLMRMLYDKAQGPSELPRYLMLFGDGSYDNLDRLADNTNYILTFQSRQSLSPAGSYVTDDFYGMLDENEGFEANGNLDIGIGRFPVFSPEQAKAMVDKFINYTSLPDLNNNGSICSGSNSSGTYGDWRNIVSFIGDDEDGNTHVYQANKLAEKIENNHKWMNVDKIYADAFQQQTTPGGQRYPDVNKAINERVGQGALLVNYTGHGGELGWALERFLMVEDIHSWENFNTLPVFVTATCEFSRFDDPGRVSAGEYVFLNEGGGAVAMFTTTRIAFSGSNFNLNNGLYNSILTKTNNQYPRLGDVLIDSKISAGSDPSNKNFVLLGNPAMRLAYPKQKIKTISINGKLAGTETDTINALEHVQVSGIITDQLDNHLSGFDGVLYPTIYDKALNMTTLGQDAASSAFPFKLQNSIIYKGKTEIKNGAFDFSFIVPKDISYNFGNGKISYYALSEDEDATGYFDDFIVGGTSSNYDPDNEGPIIRLFINDTNFVSGGITHENPILFAIIEDEHGINTTGNGIGHDIVASLDYSSTQIVLNDYYESEINSYQKGYVIYPLTELSPGTHHLSLKAWDIYNNSNTASIEFVVEPSGHITLKNVIASPNPLVDYTTFWLEHNQSCNNVNILIDIYDLAGRHVMSLNREMTPSGFKIGPIKWDGNGLGGEALSSGMYVYRILMRPDEGQSAFGSGKLNIIR